MVLSPFFSSAWIVVVAMQAELGPKLVPIALVACCDGDGTIIDRSKAQLSELSAAPYPTGPRALVVTINAQELIACHLALGWPIPERIVDLLIEFRNVSNGALPTMGPTLSGALHWHGLPASVGLVTGSTPARLRRQLDAVRQLFHRMTLGLDLGRALLRGRYMCAVARLETAGIPIDQACVGRLAKKWSAFWSSAVGIIDKPHGIFRNGRLDRDALAEWLDHRGIAWPRTGMGALDLGDDAFGDMARAHPELRPLKDVQTTISYFDPRELKIGGDGRNRTSLRPFASRTGRNQPSTKASILGAPTWARHLIRPEVGTGLAMIDWRQQEFGIAAALADDLAMQASYNTGDPYLAFAIATGSAPPTATVESHAELRDRFKACALGVQYGISAERLARLIMRPVSHAEELLRRHRSQFRRFWSWLDAVETDAFFSARQASVFGWQLAVDANANPRAVRNFPMQANGAEMLRLACCLVTEAGITVCAPNHDALLIEAPLGELDDAVATTQRLMAEASSIVLDGFELRTQVRVCRAPDHWLEPRGATIWSAVERALEASSSPAHQRHATCSETNSRPIYLYVPKEDSDHGTV